MKHLRIAPHASAVTALLLLLALCFTGCARDTELAVKPIEGGTRMVYITHPHGSDGIRNYNNGLIGLSYFVYPFQMRPDTNDLEYSTIVVLPEDIVDRWGRQMAVDDIEEGDFFDVYLTRYLEDGEMPASRIVFVGHGGEEAVEEYGWVIDDYFEYLESMGFLDEP